MFLCLYWVIVIHDNVALVASIDLVEWLYVV